MRQKLRLNSPHKTVLLKQAAASYSLSSFHVYTVNPLNQKHALLISWLGYWRFTRSCISICDHNLVLPRYFGTLFLLSKSDQSFFFFVGHVLWNPRPQKLDSSSPIISITLFIFLFILLHSKCSILNVLCVSFRWLGTAWDVHNHLHTYHIHTYIHT